MKNLHVGSILVSFAFVLFFLLAASCRLQAQAALPPAPQPEVTLHALPSHLMHDQAAIWTSPARVRTRDLDWLLPLAGITVATIATDRDAMLHVVSENPDLNQKSSDASNGLTGILAATPVALLGWGQLRRSARAREAGILGGEAMLDGFAVEEGSRFIFMRERPSEDDARGHFFSSNAGSSPSFPSLHTMVAWSSVSVLAEEYPSPCSRFLLYSAATGVSLTRVMARQHFPSDAIVGSAAGWLIGRYVFRKRHNHALNTQEDY